MSMRYRNNLKAARLASGMTQRQAADLLGLRCESRLSQWEGGTSVPSIFNLLRLARMYGTTCELLYPTDPPEGRP